MKEYKIPAEPTKAKIFIRSDRLKKVTLSRGRHSKAWRIKTVYRDPDTYTTMVVNSAISDNTMRLILPVIMQDYLEGE